MIDPELKAYVQREIQRQLNIITGGAAGENTMTDQDIVSMMPGMPTIVKRPIMFPYGFASRAPLGTLAVTGQQGENPGNKMTLGHRDKDAPSMAVGESVNYSVGGYRVKYMNDKLFIGKGEDLEEMVVGQTLKQFLVMLITHIKAHTHIGNLGFPTGVPQNVADFTNDQTNFLDNSKILAKDGGRY